MIKISEPMIGEHEKQAVLEVLESGRLTQGPCVEQFELAFAAACGAQHAIAVSSGTAALHVALLAHKIGPGDEVITTSFTFVATVNAILLVGAKPVFVDIDSNSFNIDAGLIEDAVTPRTKAIMPVHLYGFSCEMDRISDIARAKGLVVIEDAAQAIGATYKTRKIGSVGTACFSLYATKNITAGEGGMITTEDVGVAERCQLIRNHWMVEPYKHESLAYNFRLSEMHAALGLAQLGRLEEFTSKRNANAAYLSSHLKSIPGPQTSEDRRHAWHQYTVRIAGNLNRDDLSKQLFDQGIQTGIYYPVPAHQQKHIRPQYGDVCLQETEKAAREVLSLPVHPGLSESDLKYIVDQVNRF